MMKLHLGGHLAYFEIKQRALLEFALATPTRLKDILNQAGAIPHRAPIRRSNCAGRGSGIPLRIPEFGEVSEWLKEHAWKVCVRL